MATKIKFLGTGDGYIDSGVHFDGVISDFTLCGITLDGDPRTAGSFEVTNDKVDCTHCKSIVEFSKKVKRYEY